MFIWIKNTPFKSMECGLTLLAFSSHRTSMYSSKSSILFVILLSFASHLWHSWDEIFLFFYKKKLLIRITIWFNSNLTAAIFWCTSASSYPNYGSCSEILWSEERTGCEDYSTKWDGWQICDLPLLCLNDK